MQSVGKLSNHVRRNAAIDRQRSGLPISRQQGTQVSDKVQAAVNVSRIIENGIAQQRDVLRRGWSELIVLAGKHIALASSQACIRVLSLWNTASFQILLSVSQLGLQSLCLSTPRRVIPPCPFPCHALGSRGRQCC